LSRPTFDRDGTLRAQHAIYAQVVYSLTRMPIEFRDRLLAQAQIGRGVTPRKGGVQGPPGPFTHA